MLFFFKFSLVQNVPWQLQTGVNQIFEKSKNHLQILGAIQVTWSLFPTEDSQILGSTVPNSVATANSCRGFVHPVTNILQ
jgi:hypothetical protein